MEAKGNVGRRWRRIGLTSVASIAALLPLAGVAAADGDVRVTVTNGNLSVRGDAADNRIRVQEVVPGELLFIGLDGTTVNGSDRDTASGITGRAAFRLNGGDDHVFGIQKVSLPGRTYVSLGSGTNIASFRGLQVAGDLILRAGSGDDLVTLTSDEEHDSTVGGTLRIGLGSGFGTARLDSVQVEGDLKYVSRAGRDSLVLRASSTTGHAPHIKGSVVMRLGLGEGGTATLGGVLIDGDFVFQGGRGEDDLNLSPESRSGTIPTVGGSTYIRLGDGDGQSVRLLSFQGGGDVHVSSGGDSDAVLMFRHPSFVEEPLVLGRLEVELDDGDDRLTIRDVHVEGETRLDGGLGEDLLASSDNDFQAGSTVLSFEAEE